MIAAPEIKTFGDDICAIYGAAGVVFHFSRISEHKDALSAELSVTNEHGPLHWSRVNLASASGRHAVIKALEESEGDPLPWRPMLDRACQDVARHLRTAEPAVALVAAKPVAEQWLVHPWIPLEQTTVLYGSGGSAKSLLALAIAAAGILGHTLGGPWPVGRLARVMYLDWEATRHVHEGRLYGLTLAYEKPPAGVFLYRRLRRPLIDVIAELRAEAAREKVDFTILDSLAPSSGPEPEGASAAVPTLQALDSLPGTKLCIAHVSKAGADQPQAKPFGSVMVENLARSTIEVRRQDAAGEEYETAVSLYHRKANNGPLARATGVRILFDQEDGGIVLARTEPDAGNDSLPAKILRALREGSHRVTDLVEMVGSDAASVRTTLNRLALRNKVVRLVTQPGGKAKDVLWGRADTTRNSDDANA